MATKIITKNSSTATSIPTAGDLVQGELAVNVTDKRLFTEDSGGAIVELGTNPSTLTSGAATFSSTLGVTGVATFNNNVVCIANIKVAHPTQSSYYLSNAAQTGGFLVGRSISSNDAQDFFIYDTEAAATRLTISSTGAATFSGNTTIGAAVANTNVELALNGVANKATRIKFQESGTDKWLIGQGAASETSAFELYNTTGVQALSVNRTTNVATFASGAVFNELGIDSDFRVESDTNANALFVDSGNNSVGLFAGAGDTVNANLAVGLTGVVVAGDTDGATIGKASTVKLVNGNNYGSTNAGVFLLGGGTGGGVGQISSGLGFFRESSANWGTQLRFYTHPTSTADIDELKERMRLDASGNLSLYQNQELRWQWQPNDYIRGAITVDGSNNMSFKTAYAERFRINGSGHPFFPYIRNSAGSYTAKITAGSAELTFDTSSARYKENIRDSDYGLSAVMQLQSRMFEYKEDDQRTDVGFIAEEVNDVIPELVVIDAEGRPDAVNYDRMTSVLIKGMQEQQAIIEALTARIEALEGA